MSSTSYLYEEQYLIQEKSDFLRSGIREAPTVGKLITTIRRLFMITDKGLKLYSLGESTMGYAIEGYGGKLGKELIVKVYYIPDQKALDIFDPESLSQGVPLIGWRSKRLVYENYSSLFRLMKIDKQFSSLISII